MDSLGKCEGRQLMESDSSKTHSRGRPSRWYFRYRDRWAAGGYFVSISCAGPDNTESELSELSSILLSPNGAVEAPRPALGEYATGWNVYAGTSEDALTRQNSNTLGLVDISFRIDTAVGMGALPGRGAAPREGRTAPKRSSERITMTGIASKASRLLADILNGETGIGTGFWESRKGEGAQGLRIEGPLRLGNVAAELAERGPLKYPAIYLYCDRISNTLR